jgi:cytochrome P450
VSNPTVTSAFVDLLNPAFDFDGPEVAQAREQHWYAQSPIGPVVLRHHEVSELLRDQRFKLGGDGYLRAHGITGGPLYDWWSNALVSVDLADYMRLRALLNKAFTPRLVEGLRPFSRANARRLAAQIEESTTHDFVAEFADPLPALVICRLLGVPAEDYPRFHQWTADIAMAFSRAGLAGEVLARVEAAIVAMTDYVVGLLRRRRRELGDDLLSAMITAEESGGAISLDELHNLTLLLVWAGHDATARQIGRALVTFAEHPDQWQLLRQNPALIPQAVEEVCRWSPQTRLTTRYALEDLSYQDLELPAGSQLLACVSSANRDPRAFTDGDRFDITVERKAHQLVYGGGVYRCLGAALARVEMTEALLALTERFGPPTITGPITWRPPMALIHGPEALPLQFGSAM